MFGWVLKTPFLLVAMSHKFLGILLEMQHWYILKLQLPEGRHSKYTPLKTSRIFPKICIKDWFWNENLSFNATLAQSNAFFFVLVYEIWRFMKFQKQCRKNLRRSKDMLAEMEVHEKNMTRTLQEIEDLEAILNQVKLEH